MRKTGNIYVYTQRNLLKKDNKLESYMQSKAFLCYKVPLFLKTKVNQF